MPAILFEFIYSYIHLSNTLGRPPSNYELCRFLKIDNCTGLQRKKKAIQLGYIVDPGYRPEGDWCVLTDKGAEAITAVLDRVDGVYMANGQYLCIDRDHFPDNLIYHDMKPHEYRAYIQTLKANGTSARS